MASGAGTTERKIRLLDNETDPGDLVPHLVTRIASAIHQTGGRYTGGRAEQGFCVMCAELDEHEYTLICGMDTDGESLGIRVLSQDKFPTYIAAATYLVFCLVTFSICVMTGFGGKHPLLSFFLPAAGAFVASYGAFVLAGRLRGGPGWKTAGADGILDVFTESFLPEHVEITAEPCRIVGVDVSVESFHRRDEDAIEARNDRLRWTRKFRAALSGVPVD